MLSTATLVLLWLPRMSSDKISVVARVVVARKEIFAWGKLYDACTNVQTIVDGAMAKAAARTGRPLSFLSVEACRTEEAMERGGKELDAEDMPREPTAARGGAARGRCGGRSGAMYGTALLGYELQSYDVPHESSWSCTVVRRRCAIARRLLDFG